MKKVLFYGLILNCLITNAGGSLDEAISDLNKYYANLRNFELGNFEMISFTRKTSDILSTANILIALSNGSSQEEKNELYKVCNDIYEKAIIILQQKHKDILGSGNFKTISMRRELVVELDKFFVKVKLNENQIKLSEAKTQEEKDNIERENVNYKKILIKFQYKEEVLKKWCDEANIYSPFVKTIESFVIQLNEPFSRKIVSKYFSLMCDEVELKQIEETKKVINNKEKIVENLKNQIKNTKQIIKIMKEKFFVEQKAIKEVCDKLGFEFDKHQDVSEFINSNFMKSATDEITTYAIDLLTYELELKKMEAIQEVINNKETIDVNEKIKELTKEIEEKRMPIQALEATYKLIFSLTHNLELKKMQVREKIEDLTKKIEEANIIIQEIKEARDRNRPRQEKNAIKDFCQELGEEICSELGVSADAFSRADEFRAYLRTCKNSDLYLEYFEAQLEYEIYLINVITLNKRKTYEMQENIKNHVRKLNQQKIYEIGENIKNLIAKIKELRKESTDSDKKEEQKDDQKPLDFTHRATKSKIQNKEIEQKAIKEFCVDLGEELCSELGVSADAFSSADEFRAYLGTCKNGALYLELFEWKIQFEKKFANFTAGKGNLRTKDFEKNDEILNIIQTEKAKLIIKKTVLKDFCDELKLSSQGINEVEDFQDKLYFNKSINEIYIYLMRATMLLKQEKWKESTFVLEDKGKQKIKDLNLIVEGLRLSLKKQQKELNISKRGESL